MPSSLHVLSITESTALGVVSQAFKFSVTRISAKNKIPLFTSAHFAIVESSMHSFNTAQCSRQVRDQCDVHHSARNTTSNSIHTMTIKSVISRAACTPAGYRNRIRTCLSEYQERINKIPCWCVCTCSDKYAK